jgi:hypothetical protein
VRSFLLFLESLQRCHPTFPNRTKYLIVAPGKLDSQIKPAQNSRLSYSITGASLIGDFANATENSTNDGTCPVKVALQKDPFRVLHCVAMGRNKTSSKVLQRLSVKKRDR